MAVPRTWHSRCVSSCLALIASQVGPSFPVLQLFRRRPLLYDLQLLPLPLNSLLKYGVTGSNNTFTEQDEVTAEISSEYLQSENRVYRRLDHDDDIVSCLDLSGEGIRLALMENGNLQELPRQTQNTPDQSRQLARFRAMARALVHVHDRRVLAVDIATRNFLLSADLNVKLSDFNQSTILPLNADMETAGDSGYSIYTDIDQLGTVFNTVMTG